MSLPLNASLLRLKLLDALRLGATDRLDGLYQQLRLIEPTTATTDVVKLRETVLHYAVQVAPFLTIQYIVENPSRFPDVDINGQDDQGNTPLHLAAAALRLDVVKYLLSLPQINDTVVNLNKKQPVEVAKDVNVAQLMQFERAKFVEALAAKLRQYFSARDFANLDKLLTQNPRALELLDINGADPETGNTVLHEFIQKDDVKMVEWILKHGGDPFKRDKKGNLPVELIHKGLDPQLKRLLKEASQEQNIMDPVIQGTGPGAGQRHATAPTYKGYLHKWTNFASGYKLRYFVLDQAGVLLYYANQDDTASNACRGSLNLGYAQLHLDSLEKCKFEIIGKNGIHWHLRANHPVETNRWVWTLQNAITVAKDGLKRRQTSGTSSTGMVPPQLPTRGLFELDRSQTLTHTQDLTTKRLRRKLRVGRSKNKNKAQLPVEPTHFTRTDNAAPAGYYDGMEDFDLETEGNDEEDDAQNGPDTFALDVQLVTRALEVQLASLQECFRHIAEPELQLAGLRTVSAISELIGTYHGLVAQRDVRVLKQLERQLEVNRLWENLIHQLEAEIQQREQKIDEYDGRQKQLKKLFTTQLGTGGVNETAVAEIFPDDLDDEFFDALGQELINSEVDDTGELLAPRPAQPQSTTPIVATTMAKTAAVETDSAQAQSGYNATTGYILPLQMARNMSTPDRDHHLLHSHESHHHPNHETHLPEHLLEGSDAVIDEMEVIPERRVPLAPHSHHHAYAARATPPPHGSHGTDAVFPQHQELAAPKQAPPPIPQQAPPPIPQQQGHQQSQHLPPQVPQQAPPPIPQGAPPVPQGGVPQQLPKQRSSQQVPQQPHGQHPSSNGAGVAAGAAAGAGVAGAAGIAGRLDESVDPREAQQPPQQPPQQGKQAVDDQQQQQQQQEEAAPQPQANGDVKLDKHFANQAQDEVALVIKKEGLYLGYENPPRTKLALDEDDRPKVGLWGILKSMIGKDMTRMTLPVLFNEPSSLLQRLAEDIECAYLLDEAAKYDDLTLRLIYVATFAATEYALTIGRIAKPFNPLLGETFEYARPDQNYRLFTEQVSHHPPISACHADSPKWTYYGENAVDSQFKGRSFDFKHLGKMFCKIRPDNGVKLPNGEVVEEELYSWKKVNTSVVGIMLGNPTVDNYGLMEVRNHTTGDVIEVNMKQRGWSAKLAYQLSGTAVDVKGKAQWAMGGHWNSKIYAKKVDSSHDRKLLLVESQDLKVGTHPYGGGKFLVWQVAPRPNVPFNLTSFAVTLNNPDPKLLPWVAPSDTRLRPDQRDMEEGRYDQAADEKHRLEEKQRAARREREASGEKYKPLWFTHKKHPVTGDMFWDYNGEYWPKRRDHQLKGTTDIF